jgi:hypothetical protein
MQLKRSALPLPRYTLRKPSKHGWSYFFNVPSWARAAGCPLHNEPLGSDYAAAVQRAETVLLPAFDSWRGGGMEAKVAPGAAYGTLDWLFAEFRSDRRFTELDMMTRRNHEAGFRLIGGYVLQDGRRFGQIRLVSIDTAVVDALYQKLLVVKETDAAGNVVERERRASLNKTMASCRRAWNVAARRNPGKIPLVNPFARMGLKSSDHETPTASYVELQTFRAKAIALGHPSLATAALIAWEWLQRERDIFTSFEVTHYRPKERPNAVRVLHVKTSEENWIPLFDDAGIPLYPELMSELDALKKDRIGGLMLRRDWGNQPPWPTAGSGDLALMSHKTKEIIRAAGLRDELTFTSFRHGGFTEAADADLSDAEMRAAGRHKSANVLPRYAKRTMKQVEAGAKKRRAIRTKADNLSE